MAILKNFIFAAVFFFVIYMEGTIEVTMCIPLLLTKPIEQEQD